MRFDDAAKVGLGSLPQTTQYDPRFLQAARDVASGRKTVDEAWAWLKSESGREEQGVKRVEVLS